MTGRSQTRPMVYMYEIPVRGVKLTPEEMQSRREIADLCKQYSTDNKYNTRVSFTSNAHTAIPSYF